MSMKVLKSRPITNEKGEPLNDLEFAQKMVEYMDKYKEQFKKPAPVDPKFNQFMHEMVATCKTPEDVIRYKQENVLQQMDYDLVVENTTKLNNKLNKKEVI